MVIVHFLKLIRFPNLLMIALTQYLLRYFVIKPLIKVNGFELLISNLDFFLLSLSTVMIAAAGYVINDYFDIKIDRVNKPNKVIIDTHIKRRVAMGAHIVINTIGIGLGAYVAHKVDNLMLVILHIFAAFSLWYYSTHFKYDVLIGNFVIALMAAFVPLIVGLYEVPLLNKWGQENFQIYALDFDFNHIAYFTIGFAVFAFLMTFSREITKDCADINGDSQYGAKTLPIVFGDSIAKLVITFFYLITIAGLITINAIFLPDVITICYVVTLSLMIVFLTFKTWKSNTPEEYNFSGNLNKLISVLGILYMLIFPIILKKFIGA